MHVTAFESEAYAARDSAEDITNLAMVMVDFNYDHNVFDLDAVFFADELAGRNWSFEIDAADTGEQMMIIYLDVFGNEHRELKRTSTFKRPAQRGQRKRAPEARAQSRA